MKTPLLLLLLAVATLACAEPAVTPIARLQLLDGRTLKNVVIRSYDVRSAKVLVVANGKALLIPLTLIPPPYAEKIQADNPRSSADLVQTTPVPEPSAPVPPPSDTRVIPPPPPPPPAPVAPVATPADPRKAHQEAAKAHARRYYKYEYRTGSNAISVTDSDIAIDETEPVPGWSNRYRTTGKIYLEIYDSVGGGSFRRGTSRFEILTEQKPGEDIKVVDFTRK
jgi:hypothetical protein